MRGLALCLVALSLLGCNEQPAPDSPYSRMQRIIKVTKTWLGIKPPAPPRLADVAASRVDESDGRLRRRLDMTLRGLFSDAEIKADLSRRIGERSFTERIHVGAIFMWLPEDKERPMGIAIYSRDGKGWSGQTCDHLRIAGRGDEAFAALLAEVGPRMKSK